jgi:Flp pilus assembly protein TadG
MRSVDRATIAMPGYSVRPDRLSVLRRTARRFLRDRAGGTGVVFAFTLVPLLGFAGFALDYARVSLGRADLQTAVDAAGLAVALLPRNTPIEEVRQKALAWVNQSLANKGLGPVGLTARRNGTKIDFTATTTVDMTLFRILRDEPVEIQTSSEVSWDLGKVEIALVLDNTGSMVQNGSPKLDNLKTAATSLIDQLAAAATNPDQVKVGVVPFSMTVNVGAKYASAPWIDATGASPVNREIFYSANPSRFTLLQQMGVTWGGCIEGRPIPYDVQETPPSASVPATLYVPFFAPDEPDSGGDYVNNYLGDASPKGSTWQYRQGNVAKYNTKSLKTGTNGAGYKYGPNAGCALQPIVRLTSDLASVRTTIANLTAVGDTNIPLGMIWGWHLLSPNGPFADGVPYDTPDLTKFVILMTDGDNRMTETDNNNDSIYNGAGYIWQGRLGITGGSIITRQNAMDQRLSTLCSNMKAAGLQIFTVRVEVTSGSIALLQSCATRPEMFYNVKNSSDLTAIFGQIGDKISQLRLSK